MKFPVVVRPIYLTDMIIKLPLGDNISLCINGCQLRSKVFQIPSWMHASQSQYFFGLQAESELLLFGQVSALAITMCHRNLPLWGCVSLPGKPAWGSYNLRHSAKKKCRRLGNVCMPIWHTKQEGYWSMVDRGLTSSTLLLGSESTEIKKNAQICTSWTNSYLQNKRGVMGVQLLLLCYHRLGFECQPANFLAPLFFFCFLAVLEKCNTPASCYSGQMRGNCCTKTKQEGAGRENEERARAGVFCSESHGQLAC